MDFFAEHKKGMLFSVIGLMLLVIVTTTLYHTNASFAENMVAYVVIPIEKTVGVSLDFFSDRVSSIQEKKNLADENQTLKADLQKAKEDNERLLLLEKENERLSKLLHVGQKYAEIEKVYAKVVAKNPGVWYDRFVIDAGSNDEVENKMLVLASNGLVGYIVKTGKTYSQVMSIIDDASSISVMSTRTEDIGVLKGDYELKADGLCRMNYISEEAEIVEGDEIVTSHISGFPPGIKIGHVKEVKTDINGITKYAIVQPDVDFEHIVDVLIIKKAYINPEVNEEK